jgi:putative transcriptional regulator
MENRLRVLRAERNWSQQDLAERIEVSRQSVNAIETGKYDPSLPLAFRIAELFDRPIEDIFVSVPRFRAMLWSWSPNRPKPSARSAPGSRCDRSCPAPERA